MQMHFSEIWRQVINSGYAADRNMVQINNSIFTFSFDNSVSICLGSPYTGTASSKLLLVLSSHASTSSMTESNLPRLIRPSWSLPWHQTTADCYSNIPAVHIHQCQPQSQLLSTDVRQVSVSQKQTIFLATSWCSDSQRLLTSAIGSRIITAWSAELLFINSSAAKFSSCSDACLAITSPLNTCSNCTHIPFPVSCFMMLWYRRYISTAGTLFEYIWHNTIHPSETVRLPWQVHERGTVYHQLSAQPPHRSLPLKKNLNHFCLDCHSVCDNVYCLLTMFSALAAVCTVYCAIEIVFITLHYITLPSI